MINNIHAKLHQPSNGWDPIPFEYAQKYAVRVWAVDREALFNELDQLIGGFKGKRVLDLGAGPGHHSVAFAKRGANVTWFDVSNTYRQIAEQKAKENGVDVKFVIGYLDEAPEKLKGQEFDLVFNNICWNYSFNDYSFAAAFYALVKPQGFGYIDAANSSSNWDKQSFVTRILNWVNKVFKIKIGHPFPPRGRIAAIFLKKKLEKLIVDYKSPSNDRIIFIKGNSSIL